jgi:hypothetical protein
LPAIRCAGAVICLVALCACAATRKPAVIAEQTAAGRAELSGVIANALHSEHVTLADDALMGAPSLVLERIRAKDEQGLLINGRDLSRPEVFRLYLTRQGCLLIHAGSEDRWLLKQVTCRSAASDF